MNILSLKHKPLSLVWLEPHRIQAGDHRRALAGMPTEDELAQALVALPEGPTSWVIDDLWAPTILLRDIVELPAGAEAREAFFKWRYQQSLALEGTPTVQAHPLGENAWLLAGMPEATRDAWLRVSTGLARPMHSLVPRWLWIYNRMAPTRERPGMLLSLCPTEDGDRFTGSLVAWGRDLALMRQWSEPLDAKGWTQERVLPTAAYLQRESRYPQDLLVWGAPHWPEGPIPHQILPPVIPVQEVC
jgi:hypothetical protein